MEQRIDDLEETQEEKLARQARMQENRNEQAFRKQVYELYGEYLDNLCKPYPRDLLEAYRRERAADSTHLPRSKLHNASSSQDADVPEALAHGSPNPPEQSLGDLSNWAGAG